MDVLIRPVTAEDCQSIADNMRQADQLEVGLSHGDSPLEAISRAVAASRWAMSLICDDKHVCAFGVAGRFMATTAAPWMLGTDEVLRNKSTVAQVSRKAIPIMRQGVKLLENYTHVDNLISIKWLRWLGFRIEPAERYGNPGGMFHRFHMEGDLCAVQQGLR